MDLKQMYKGMPFSPIATLTANISATDTIIPVSDVNAFPEAPSIAVIGPDIGPNETIIYTEKTTTALTGCTRGVESTASAWDIDEIIVRNFTAKDHNDIIDNIKDLALNKLDATYKVDVVNDSTITAGGKALDARQNNPNVEGTLAKKIAENTKQINICKEKFVEHTYTFLNGWQNAYSTYGNAPLSIKSVNGQLVIRGIISNPSEVLVNTNVLQTSCASKHMIHAYICNSGSVCSGIASFILENGYLKLVAPNSLSIASGFLAFM